MTRRQLLRTRPALLVRHAGRALLVLATGAALGSTASLRAADWAFRPSYFSHALPPEAAAWHPQPESRSAYRLPIAGDSPGFAARGGFRWNVIRLQAGQSRDTTFLHEGWFEDRPLAP